MGVGGGVATTGAAAGAEGGGGLESSAPNSSAVELAKAAISLSSSHVIARGVPTGRSEEPAGTKIFAKKPSSCASKSIVALSVSISTIMSRAAIASPSCLAHLAMPPISIVGLSAAIGIISCVGYLAENHRCVVVLLTTRLANRVSIFVIVLVCLYVVAGRINGVDFLWLINCCKV